jgi:hypothetical protein
LRSFPSPKPILFLSFSMSSKSGLIFHIQMSIPILIPLLPSDLSFSFNQTMFFLSPRNLYDGILRLSIPDFSPTLDSITLWINRQLCVDQTVLFLFPSHRTQSNDWPSPTLSRRSRGPRRQ